jgi:GH15 family glucan-1,4-alpha-glucosidase
MSSRPIGDHALLSDRHSAALVSSDGSIDWLCMPRFDSPSVFAAILDDDAGHWSIRPDGDSTVRREYAEDSLVLHTEFHTSTGPCCCATLWRWVIPRTRTVSGSTRPTCWRGQ